MPAILTLTGRYPTIATINQTTRIGSPEPGQRLQITWFGHAAFGFEADGVRVIIDPYRAPDSGGYLPIAAAADVVVVSHENDRYHSHLGQIVPPFAVVRSLEIPPAGQVVGGVRFAAFPVFETPERRPEDRVAVVWFTLGGVRVAFLGDLGHPLDEGEAALIRNADVLLVPAGGPPTIALAEVSTLLQLVQPRLVIPMHYLTAGINLKLEPVESFLAALPGWQVEAVGESLVVVDPAFLARGRRIVRLEAARLP